MAPALLPLVALLVTPQPTSTKKADPPLPPPRPLALAPLPDAPKVGNPSLDGDGKRLLISRFGDKAGGRAAQLYLVDVEHPREQQSVELVGANDGDGYRGWLSADGKRIAYLAGGELWVIASPGSDAKPQEATRLYPPKEGDAPLGPRLSHAAWSPDGSWLLIHSPTGWARVSVEAGELAPLPLHPVDLTGGSLLLGPDGRHAAFVRPTAGPGWINGAKVIVVNIETGQAQMADFDHDYTEIAALPDGQLLGKDSDGKLWALHGRQRTLYFTPPPVPHGSSIGQYVISHNLSRLAYVVSDGEGPASSKHSKLFVGTPPRLPPLPKPREAADSH